MRNITLLSVVVLGLALTGCMDPGTEWIYPDKGWSIQVLHYDTPDRIYTEGAEGYYQPYDGYKILALWVVVDRLDEQFSATLRDEYTSWKINDGPARWTYNLMVRNYTRVGALQTQEPFKPGERREGYLYYVVQDDFDISKATLTFHYSAPPYNHVIAIDLSEAQPLSNSM